jgi:hypothetical protein
MKLKNVLIIIAFICVALIIFNKPIYASSNWFDDANKFIDKGSKTTVIDTNITDADGKPTAVGAAVQRIGSILLAIGAAVSVGATIILGIKYVTCGSANEQAKLKTQFVGLIVSMVVIFGANIIWRLAIDILNGAF